MHISHFIPKFQSRNSTEINEFVRYKVLRVVTMKITVFWDLLPCNPVDIYQCLWEATLKMETEHSSKTSVNFYQTTMSQETAIFQINLFMEQIIS
jgi:hypothetical protein